MVSTPAIKKATYHAGLIVAQSRKDIGTQVHEALTNLGLAVNRGADMNEEQAKFVAAMIYEEISRCSRVDLRAVMRIATYINSCGKEKPVKRRRR